MMNTKAFLTVFAILFVLAACAPQQTASAQPAAQPAQVEAQPSAAAAPAVVPEEAPVQAPPAPQPVLPPGANVAPAPKPKTIDVAMKGFSFSPPDMEVPAGTTVRWTNQDSAPHTATADDKSFDTGSIQTGKSASHTFDKPGTYTYHCAIHQGMKGKIVVT